MKQEWQQYMPDDHEVWNILFERQLKNLADKAWSSYLTCVPAAGLTATAVPDFRIVDAQLAQHTGWKIEVVKGIIPVDQFLELLAQKRFCSSTWLRKRHQLDYLEEPDMFHDTFGHLPLLIDRDYADFVERFAALGLRHRYDETALLLLERLYWFTIEFGLLRENGALKIYGAGILSSFGESNHVFGKTVTLPSFDIAEVLRTPFRNNEVQQLYFVVNDLRDLWNCLDAAEQFILEVRDGKIDRETLRLQEQMGSVMSNVM